MTSFHQKSQGLIEKAEQCEWNLECDEKLLELMQNVAGKIESRSANTRSNINTMMLGLDETKVKLGSLTRINSIKNTNYCENLIKEDHLELDSPTSEEPKKETVKLSPQTAIGNGLKMMEHCFEKHKVILDPSSSQSITSTVYRPIDKYRNVLPHLIGSEKWKEKWHVGLLDTDVTSHAESEQYAESIDSNAMPSTSIQTGMQEPFVPGTSLMASQDSLAKSASSIGDQMVINEPGRLFDEDEHLPFTNSNPPSSTLFFRPQVDQRKIVNLFDDEPPSLEHSPVAERRPVNLFDDYGSVESLTSGPSVSENIVKQQQPVDLFNDNEFDDFIKKIETQSKESNAVISPAVKKPEIKAPQVISQPDMRKISEEIKKVQLKKVETGAREVVKKSHPIVEESVKKPIPAFKENSKTLPKASVLVKKKEPDVIVEPPVKPQLKKITNLFDDEDEPEDFLNEIMKQKSSKVVEPVTTKSLQPKKKLTSLFDDEDEDDTFDEIFNKKPAVNSLFSNEGEPMKANKKTSSLFDDDDEPSLLAQTKPDTVKKNMKNLFEEDDVSASFEQKLKVVEALAEKVKPQVPEAPETFETTATPTVDMVKPDSKIIERVTVENLQNESENIEDTKVIDEVKVIEKEIETIPVTIVEEIRPEIVEVSDNEPTIVPKIPIVETLFPHPTISSNLPFLNDEPPEDDELWENEVPYDDPEPIFHHDSSSYPTVPIFDDIPPDDDFVPSKSETAPEFIFEDDDDVEPNFASSKIVPKDSEVPQVKSIDELDKSLSSSSIKSKLYMFSKRADELPPTSIVKKALPGKLNMNIKINVGALMPGARLPSRDAVERLDTPENERIIAQSSTASSTDPNNNSSLLNNELAKSRAKIKVKRRPSTRRGRQSNYQRSLSLNVTDDGSAEDDSENRNTLAHSATVPSITAPTKNLSVSIFDDMDDDEEIIIGIKEPVTDKKEKISALYEKEASQAKPISSAVTTSKVSVFYDDEDDTRLMVEQHRKFEDQEKKKNTKPTPTAGLFDDDDGDDFLSESFIPSIKKIPTKVVQSKEVQSASYDESDDDLFSTKNVAEVIAKPPKAVIKPPAKTAKQSVPKPKQSNSLFDDVDDDDLFESASKKSTPNAVMKPSKLFKSDNEMDTSNSIIFNKPKAGQPKNQSLFGDDESDDDDLFSSKAKPSSKSSTSTSKTSTIVKKQTTKAVDDPLKDLLNN